MCNVHIYAPGICFKLMSKFFNNILEVCTLRHTRLVKYTLLESKTANKYFSKSFLKVIISNNWNKKGEFYIIAGAVKQRL